MALQGNLKDSSITEVFQLIAQQQKTGVLTLLSKGEKAQVAFDNGMVVMAGSDLKRMDDLLGQRLVRSALVTQEQLDDALQTQKGTLQMVGQILVEKGHLQKDPLRKALLLQVQEAVYRLLDWKDGNYDFEAQEVRYDKSLYTPLSTEYVLMEGQRILDEWPIVRKMIPTNDMVFRIKGKKPSGEEGDLIPLESSAGLLPEQEKILGLVDGHRRVHEIVDYSRLGEFEATKALSELLTKGLIEALPEEKPATTRRKPVNITAVVVNMASFAMIVVIVILVLSYATMTSRKLLGDSGRRQTVSIEHSLESLGHFQEERIRTALDLYYLEHENYPESLELLVSDGILRKDELTFPWRKMYYYQKRGGEYILLQPKR